MAHFVGTIDPSADRRSRFAERAQRELSASNGSPAKVFERADLTLVSWSQSWEPFRHVESAEAVSFLWGHSMERGQNARSHPDIGRLWRSVPERVPLPLEGMHIAFSYRADGTWIAGADLFGVMPVYYSCGKDYAIVGSTPELFRAHPDFVATLDPAGLAGILMTNGLVNGRALLRGVRRLDSGALLFAPQGGAPRELPQYRPEMSDRYFGDTFERNYERVLETLEDCFERHLDPASAYGLLLSGGLDSRLVAGLMKRRGVELKAFSLGSPRDIEVQCAVAVAKALPVPHEILPSRMDRYVEYAQNECKWNHLANGLSGIALHEPIADAAQFQAGLLSGYAKEAVIGASHISFAGDDPNRMSFDLVFKKENRWGLPVAMIKRLFAKSFAASIVDDVHDEFEQSYRNGAEREWQSAWLFSHYFRGRFHTSAVLGLHSQWPWPVVPYIDTKLLDLMGGMPYAHVKSRRMQYHMLKTEFPELARVSLDRNSFNMKPLLPRYSRVVDHLLFKPREFYYRWTRRLEERRYYYRTMDFDSTGWNAVRAAAEPYRQRALQILDDAALAEILPQPGERRVVADGIIDSSKAKLMIGFLLWSAAYV
jgi:asparagine synthase (glutamine-hydrolysing)